MIKKYSTIGVLCLAFFFYAIFDYTKDNDFSYHYHSDEITKVQQIESNTRNFHHPVLNLELANFFSTLFNKKKDLHDIVLVGRTQSAVLQTLTGILLIILAWRLGGIILSIILAIVLATNPYLYIYSHIFKEDPLLLFSITASLFFLPSKGYKYKYINLPLVLSAIFAGMAIASKYIGILWLFSVIITLTIFKLQNKNFKIKTLVYYLSISLLTFLIFNIKAFINFNLFIDAFNHEVDKVIGDEIIKAKVNRNIYINVFRDKFLNFTIFALILFLINIILQRKKFIPAYQCSMIFSIIYLLTLIISARSSTRYYLPIQIFTLFYVYTGLYMYFIKLLPKISKLKFSRLIYIATIIASILFISRTIDKQLEKKKIYYNKINYIGDRKKIFDFIRNELPKNSIIYYDKKIGLIDPKYPQQYKDIEYLPQKVVFCHAPHGFQTLEKLKESEATHLLTTFPRSSSSKNFYNDLKNKTKIIFTQKKDSKSYFRRNYVIYELKP